MNARDGPPGHGVCESGVSRIAGCTGLNIISVVQRSSSHWMMSLLACQRLSPSGPGAGGAQRSIALRFMAMSISMYSLVVVMLTCPGQDLITLSPAPDWSRCRAVVWRRVCGLTGLAASGARVVAATAMLRLRIVPTPKRVMRLPWALRNSGASGWVPSARWRRPLQEADPASAPPRRPHQRLRAGRIEAQVRAGGRVLKPTGRSSAGSSTSTGGQHEVNSPALTLQVRDHDKVMEPYRQPADEPREAALAALSS